MNPNANLEEQLKIARAICDREVSADDIERLAELVLAMNEYLSSGEGYLPKAWSITLDPD